MKVRIIALALTSSMFVGCVTVAKTPDETRSAYANKGIKLSIDASKQVVTSRVLKGANKCFAGKGTAVQMGGGASAINLYKVERKAVSANKDTVAMIQENKTKALWGAVDYKPTSAYKLLIDIEKQPNNKALVTTYVANRSLNAAIKKWAEGNGTPCPA